MKVQAGLEIRTRNTERHPNTERFKVLISNHYGGHFCDILFRFRSVGMEQKNDG